MCGRYRCIPPSASCIDARQEADQNDKALTDHGPCCLVGINEMARRIF